MRKRRIEKLQAQCDHSRTVSTVYAGIERKVCESCGQVRMMHRHEQVTNRAAEREDLTLEPAS